MEEYKLSEDFLDNMAERSVSTFHKGFKDCHNKMKELFPDVNIALLIPSIANPIAEEKVMEVQEDIGAPAEAPPSTLQMSYLLLRHCPILKRLWR